MKIGYENYWIELSLKDSLEKVKVLCKKAITKIDNTRIQKLVVGLKLRENDFVYQRGVVKMSLEQLSQVQIPYTAFRRPFLSDIFKDKLLSSTDEKSWDEPEDENCDVYLYI